jgi:hypothetical protein
MDGLRGSYILTKISSYLLRIPIKSPSIPLSSWIVIQKGYDFLPPVSTNQFFISFYFCILKFSLQYY